MPANSAGWDCSSFSRSPVLGSHPCNAAVSNTALCSGMTNGVPLPAAIAFLQTPCPISLAWAFCHACGRWLGNCEAIYWQRPSAPAVDSTLGATDLWRCVGSGEKSCSAGPPLRRGGSLSLTGPRTFPERGAVVRGREAPRPFSLRLPSNQKPSRARSGWVCFAIDTLITSSRSAHCGSSETCTRRRAGSIVGHRPGDQMHRRSLAAASEGHQEQLGPVLRQRAHVRLPRRRCSRAARRRLGRSRTHEGLIIPFGPG